MDLFSSEKTPIRLNMIDSEIVYYPSFFGQIEASNFFKTFLDSIQWQQDTIRVYGKVYPQPRLTALYANNRNTYSYSNITMTPHQFTEELLFIKKEIENIIPTQFTSCLLNLYRDGMDSNGWHADNEKELGPEPVIASVSFGEERWFQFKHKTKKNSTQKILLQSGSLLIMRGETQENWLHQLPKSKKITKPRINLTFRVIP